MTIQAYHVLIFVAFHFLTAAIMAVYLEGD
jgi:hypothetical protein